MEFVDFLTLEKWIYIDRKRVSAGCINIPPGGICVRW